MPVFSYGGVEPAIHPSASVDPSAVVVGRVTIGAQCSLGPGAVLRGDSNAVTLGRRVSVGEYATVHTEMEAPTRIGNDVIIAPHAVVHACHVEDAVLIEAQACVLSGSRIGRGSILKAGCLVPEGSVIQPRSVVAGVPGKVVGRTTKAEGAAIRARASAEWLAK